MNLTNEEIALLKSLLDKLSPPPTEGAVASPQVAVPFPPLVKLQLKILSAVKYLSPVHWKEDIAYFKTKKFVLYIALCFVIYGVAYWHGTINKPIHLNLGGQEVHLMISKDEQLHILKDGTVLLEDADGNKLRTIKISDIPELKKALKPFGFDIHPFMTAGGSMGTDTNKRTAWEAGAGFQWFKIYRVHIDSFLTNIGIYPLGIDYQLTQNFSILSGIGKGYSNGNDTRIYLGGLWKF
jgi:hypothetical protein